MSDQDQFLQTVEAIYAGGLERDRLPAALELFSNLLGGVGATLEVVDKSAQQHLGYWSSGLPTIARTPYIEHYAALNPRIPFASRQPAGQVVYDNQIIDEAGMARDPFYAEFLPQMGLRYCVGAILEQTPEKLTACAVQRTRKQGHADKREISIMGRLVPHFQRAYDMATRLQTASNRDGILENALGWLTDGVALLRADGRLVFANDALRALAQRGDGIRISESAVEFAAPDARRRFAGALDAVQRIGDPSFASYPTDFPVPRADGAPAYTISVRPLLHRETRTTHHADAAIMVLIHDPLDRNIAAGQMLQELYGLTNAEAQLAQALCTGMTTRGYASKHQVSITTVYTHLRRLREKTGYKSVAELVCNLGALNVPLRLS